MRIGVVFALLMVCLGSVGADTASAQRSRGDRGRREEGGERDGRSRGPGGQEGGERDGRSRGPGGQSDRFESFLRSLDANGDGVIAPDEIDARRKGFFEGYARRAGLDPTRPIPLAALREAAQRSSSSPGRPDGQGPRPGGPPSFGSGPPPGPPGMAPPGAPRDGQSPSKPLVLALNSQGSQPPVGGFGSPTSSSPGPSGRPSSGAPSGSSGSPAAPAPGVDPRVRQYAEGLLRQYDKNKNGTLEREEWSEMRGSARESDANGDGVITLDEMIARLGGHGRSSASAASGGPPPAPGGAPSVSGSPSSAANSPAGGASNSTSKTGGPRKPYRALLPHERLPEGLPEWFVRKDANQDGQVSMAEFSAEWSEAKAKEFIECDLNNDGIITPAEALKAKK